MSSHFLMHHSWKHQNSGWFQGPCMPNKRAKVSSIPYVHWVLRMGASFWYWIYQAKWFMAPASSGSDSEKKDTCNEACPTLFNFSFTQCLTKTWESFGCWGWISREPRGENHHFTYKGCGRLHRLVFHCISSSYPTTRVNWAPGSLPLVWWHHIVGPSRQTLAFK